MADRASQREFWSQHTVREVIAASQQVHSSQSHSSAPHPVTDLPDLVRKPPVGEAAECDTAGKKGRKRSEEEIQLQMFNAGAFFFQFGAPITDPKGGAIPKTAAYEGGVKDFRTMESKGFRVTVDGCLIPYEHYCTPKKGAVLKGHQRSAYFFTGLTPQSSTGKKERCAPNV